MNSFFIPTRYTWYTMVLLVTFLVTTYIFAVYQFYNEIFGPILFLLVYAPLAFLHFTGFPLVGKGEEWVGIGNPTALGWTVLFFVYCGLIYLIGCTFSRFFLRHSKSTIIK